MPQPPVAQPLQPTTSSSNSLVDISFFSPLTSSSLTTVTASLMGSGGRNQVTASSSCLQLILCNSFSQTQSCLLSIRVCVHRVQVESWSVWRRCVVFVTWREETWLTASSVMAGSTHTATSPSESPAPHLQYYCTAQYWLITTKWRWDFPQDFQFP